MICLIRRPALVLGLLALAAELPAYSAEGAAAPGKPDIIFILADDMGWGELGCYGQKVIGTPAIDRMASEGIRFTRFYAGSTVCAPSRSVLMTGLHTGHTRVRGNAGLKDTSPQSLRDEDVTVAEVLRKAGYRTACIGKWGLGLPGEEGVPERQGFDEFFGFLSQHHAHNHYPDYLYRNGEKVPIPNVVTPVGEGGAGYATKRVQYAGDLFAEEALAFVERNRDRPFFLYLAVTVPHANNERGGALKDGMEVPDHGVYAGRDWPDPQKGHAAMISRLDSDVGRLRGKLEELGIASRTVVFFSSDNGPHKEGGAKPEFFDSNGPLRGIKRDLTDGGIRVPCIAWWPGRIRPAVSDHIGCFWDFLPTAADLAGAEVPSAIDGLSLAPALLGMGVQKKHDSLYWEFHEGGASQAVLLEGRWKGIRLKRRDAPIQLHDLESDPGEERDVAGEHPEIVRRIEEVFRTARTESPLWPLEDAKKAGRKRI
jgi:arylsulfatase A-like enzyme